MRDYQTKANVGGGADSIVSTKFGAGEFNSLTTENENAVLRSGLALAAANGAGEDTTQLAQSLFIHSVKSSTFQDSGSANAYVLTPVSGASGVLMPSNYDALDGMRVVFTPGANNTGATTVDIGQTSGTLLGSKALLRTGGAALTGDEVVAGVPVEITFDASAASGAGAWLMGRLIMQATETEAGIVERATEAEARAFTANKYLDAARLASAFTGANQDTSVDGYQKLPGGLILQWGRFEELGTPLPANSAIQRTISFPIPFPTQRLVLTATPEVNYLIVAPSTGVTASQFTVNLSTTQTFALDIGFSYMAIGI